MNPVKLIAILLIIAGILGLAYGGFSYTKDTTVVKLGPLEVSAKESRSSTCPSGPVSGLSLSAAYCSCSGARDS
jgi:hypothetical protein